jgi:hypothetical protein
MTDTERLDFLQALLRQGKYTGKCICRWSTSYRGFRLHETSREGAVESVREAIDKMAHESEARLQAGLGL